MKRFIDNNRHKIIKFYQKFFVRKRMYFYNKLLLELALRGVGVLNYESDRLSGETNFLKRFMKKHKAPTIFDVGANVGNYCKNCKQIDPDSKIFAFEPHPTNFKKLEEAVLNLGVTTCNAGVGNNTETLSLYDYGDNDGSEHASLYKDVLKTDKLTEHKVEVITIDNFVRENSIEKIHLLKIDTEGNEYKVLLGAKETLDLGKIDIIHFEFNEMNLVSKVSFKDFIDILPDYRFYRLLPDGIVGISYSSIECEIFAYQNIIAVKKGIEL